MVFCFARLPGGDQRGQSTAIYFCLETGHLCICQGYGYFVNGALQDLSVPDILVAKNKLAMLVELYFELPVPQIQGHWSVRPLSIKTFPFPLYLIIVQ